MSFYSKKIKICTIQNGFLVKRRNEKAFFKEAVDALGFAAILLRETRIEYSFEQILDAIDTKKVDELT